MKRLKFLIFLLIFQRIFFLIYRNSNKKGFRKLRISFVTIVILAASLASLNFEITEVTKPSVSNRQIVYEKLVSNQKFTGLEENDKRVLLVKADGNSFLSLPGASGFTNAPPTFHNRPQRPNLLSPNVNPYKTPFKLVNQGFGAGGGGNPGGGGGNDEFDDNRLGPKKEKLSKSKTYDYSLNNKKKRKQSAEQCELKETPEEKEKREKECKEIEEELRKNGNHVSVAIRPDGFRVLLEHNKIRYKSYHFKDFGIPFPESFDEIVAEKLKKNSNQIEYRKYCRDNLLDEFIDRVAKQYKKHLMDL